MTETSLATPQRSVGRWKRAFKLGLGLVISAAFLYATLRTVPFGRVWSAMSTADLRWIAAGVLAIAIAYGLRIERWATMLRELGGRVRFADAAVPLMGSVALNNILPFRAGDVVRVVGFRKFTTITTPAKLGTLVLERLLDLLVLMTLLFLATALSAGTTLDQGLWVGLRFVAAGVAVAIAIFIASPPLIRLVVGRAERWMPRLAPVFELLLKLSDAISALCRPGLLLRLTGLSTLSWLAEGLAYFSVAQALGSIVQPIAALLSLCIGTLATVIPSSPGYVGTFHYFVARVSQSFGADLVAATAYAVLIHALLWLCTTGCGFLLLAVSELRAARQPAVISPMPQPDSLERP